MMSSTHIPHWLKSVAWFWGSLCLLLVTVSAQPIATGLMAYATINEKTFYVLGGARPSGIGISFTYPPQFYSLDLTQHGWNTSNPPWKMMHYPLALQPDSVASSNYSIANSPDNRTLDVWVVVDPNMLVKYDFGNDTWTQVPVNNSVHGAGVRAVTDPTTGLVYFPGGGGSNSDMVVYDSNTGLFTNGPSNSSVVTVEPFYSFTWNSQLNKFIYFTGNVSTANVSTVNPFYEFTPSTGQWSQMVTYGSTPPPQYRSCLISALNGSKMILFGGDDGSVSTSSLYILDVPTMTWTQATSAFEGRSGMACAVSGNSFVVWGGFTARDSLPFRGVSAEPLVYNLASQEWTTTY